MRKHTIEIRATLSMQTPDTIELYDFADNLSYDLEHMFEEHGWTVKNLNIINISSVKLEKK